MIEIRIGDKVKEVSSDRIGIVRDIKLVPNCMENPNLIAQLFVEMKNGNYICATANRFIPIDTEKYAEFFPSSHLFKLHF